MKKLLRIVVPILLAALVVASIGWYLFVFDREFTRDMLLQQARYNDMYGNPRLSAWFYNMAYAQSGNDEDVAIELANQYIGDGNYTKAEVTLSRAIHAGPTPELYTALCKTYVVQDKLMDAVALLAGVPEGEIRNVLEQHRPSAPIADQLPGFYSQYIKVGLSSSSGTLLYTTTGEYPSIKDEPYNGPITMPSGETVLYCISVDNNGLVSPLSIMNYTVGGVIEPAVFMDPTMESAALTALGKDPGFSLYTNHLWEIKEFVVPAEVTTLEDLGLMSYLETLTISNLRIDSLSALSGLSKLRSLTLDNCSFPNDDLSIIAKLPMLNRLTITNCGMSSISGLDGAVGLNYLNLSGNAIRNIDILSGMSGLTELHLQYNAIIDLEPLNSLKNLQKLDVSFNILSSLQPISDCTALTWVNASNNQLPNVDGVATLPALTSLSLSYNQLTDISELSALLQLQELSISNNSISDFSPLDGLSRLEIVDISYNQAIQLPSWPEGSALRVIDCSYNHITDLEVLERMPNLTYVSADYNQITEVNNLAECPSLVQINVYGNSIEDVSELMDHDVIVNYDPTAAE